MRAQQAILQLQAEVEKLHHTTSDIIDENKTRTKELQDLLAYCDRLQEQKADKEYVQMEVDVVSWFVQFKKWLCMIKNSFFFITILLNGSRSTWHFSDSEF